MRRGDIVRVQLPSPQGKPGREQIGTRPAVVVQAGGTYANLSTVVIVPLTSKLKALQLPGSLELLPTKENGLAAKSVVLTHQLRALDKNRVLETIGVLSDAEIHRVDAELRNLLGLSLRPLQ